MSEGVLALEIARARSEDCCRTLESGLKRASRIPLDLNDKNNEQLSYNTWLLSPIYVLCSGSV